MVFISFYPDYVPSFWRLRIHLFRFLFTLVNSAAGWFYVNGQEHKSYPSKMLNPSLTARVMPGQWSGALVSNAGEKMVSHLFRHNKGTQSQAWLSAFFFGFKTYIETKTFYFYIFVVFFFSCFWIIIKFYLSLYQHRRFFFAFFFLWPLLIPGLILVTLFLRLFQTEDILDHAQAQTTLRPWTSFLPACTRPPNIYLSTVYQLAHCTKTD